MPAQGHEKPLRAIVQFCCILRNDTQKVLRVIEASTGIVAAFDLDVCLPNENFWMRSEVWFP